MSEFHEHPPLAMGLESIYFKLFGTSRFVEKFYSLTTCLLVVFGIMKLWIQLGFQKMKKQKVLVHGLPLKLNVKNA